MPHFGLMDEKKLGPKEGSLQRARLHLRGGRRRLRQGKISAGIVTLYDAIEGAMQAYVADPLRKRALIIKAGEDLNSEKTLFTVLVRSGVLNGTFDFDRFDQLTERALHEEIQNFDYRELLLNVETVMMQLGVVPFDEALLPPEDPNTF